MIQISRAAIIFYVLLGIGFGFAVGMISSNPSFYSF